MHRLCGEQVLSQHDRQQIRPHGPAVEWPEWGLFVREPFATRIVAGIKTWEMRKGPTDKRGRIGILSERGVIGTVNLCDCLGPFAVEQLGPYVDKHRAPLTLLDRYAAGRPLFAWVLREPVVFGQPIVHRPGRGPVVWFRLGRPTPPPNPA